MIKSIISSVKLIIAAIKANLIKLSSDFFFYYSHLLATYTILKIAHTMPITLNTSSCVITASKTTKQVTTDNPFSFTNLFIYFEI